MPFPRAFLALLLCAPSLAAQVSPAITSDPPQDKLHPATMMSFQLPSHGAPLNALAYIAAGAGPHPVVILLHGFPGNEKNLDLAQAIRRDGWDVVFFNYRGSWGSPGEFSFGHSLEDTQAAIAYVRDPSNAAKLHADPQRIVLIGHSMGGFMAAWATAHDPALRGLVLISAADMAGRTRLPAGIPAEQRRAAVAKIAAGLAREGMAPLAGCSPEGLAEELIQHADEWSFSGFAAGIGKRPTLVITSNDGLQPADEALASAIKATGNQQVKAAHLETDHSYSDQRIALEQLVLNELDLLSGK